MASEQITNTGGLIYWQTGLRKLALVARPNGSYALARNHLAMPLAFKAVVGVRVAGGFKIIRPVGHGKDSFTN